MESALQAKSEATQARHDGDSVLAFKSRIDHMSGYINQQMDVVKSTINNLESNVQHNTATLHDIEDGQSSLLDLKNDVAVLVRKISRIKNRLRKMRDRQHHLEAQQKREHHQNSRKR